MNKAILAILLAACFAGSAKAADLYISGGGRYVAGHYERRIEQVLVEPGHYERTWVEAITETREEGGKIVTVTIRPGYYNRIWVPDRYEAREVNVWIPGYYIQERPTFFLGFGFGHRHHHHHHHHGHRHHDHHKHNHGHRR